jgi:DNA-directed RNA polymerase subunit RPC12/RpoP
MKPICVKCGRYFKPFKIGIRVLEQMPRENGVKPGNEHNDRWRPYKIWQADLYKCHGCGAEIVTGFGTTPIAEHYMPQFENVLAAYPPRVTVNDC